MSLQCYLELEENLPSQEDLTLAQVTSDLTNEAAFWIKADTATIASFFVLNYKRLRLPTRVIARYLKEAMAEAPIDELREIVLSPSEIQLSKELIIPNPHHSRSLRAEVFLYAKLFNWLQAHKSGAEMQPLIDALTECYAVIQHCIREYIRKH